MGSNATEENVIVRPVDGMQLSEGCIRMEASCQFIGILSGMTVSVGDSIEEVLQRMNRFAKAFYGEDVIVEIVPHTATA